MSEKITLKNISEEEFYDYKFCRIKRYHDSVFLPKEIRHANLSINPVQYEKSILEKSVIDIISIGEQNVFVFQPNFPECVDYSYAQAIIRDEFDFIIQTNDTKKPIGFFRCIIWTGCLEPHILDCI